MNPTSRSIALALATLALTVACPMTASAAVGVGTTTPRIVIDQAVQPGGIYRLPVIPVINTGTERTAYKIFVDRASTQTQLYVEPQWITISPATVSIEASGSALIDATIQIPLSARPGEYQALIVAQPIVAGASPDTPNIQVGTKVVFRVVQSNWLIALYWRIRSLFDLWAPWSYVGLALLVALPICWFLFRRYRFSFAIFRRS